MKDSILKILIVIAIISAIISVGFVLKNAIIESDLPYWWKIALLK